MFAETIGAGQVEADFFCRGDELRSRNRLAGPDMCKDSTGTQVEGEAESCSPEVDAQPLQVLSRSTDLQSRRIYAAESGRRPEALGIKVRLKFPPPSPLPSPPSSPPSSPQPLAASSFKIVIHEPGLSEKKVLVQQRIDPEGTWIQVNGLAEKVMHQRQEICRLQKQVKVTVDECACAEAKYRAAIKRVGGEAAHAKAALETLNRQYRDLETRRYSVHRSLHARQVSAAEAEGKYRASMAQMREELETTKREAATYQQLIKVKARELAKLKQDITLKTQEYRRLALSKVELDTSCKKMRQESTRFQQLVTVCDS